MTSYERYYKFFPLFSCILLLIAFLAPVGGRSMFMGYSYMWIWGLVSYGSSIPYYGSNSETIFVNTMFDSALPLIISVICFVILLSMAAKLANSYSDIKNEIIDEYHLKKIGIITIISMLIYVIIMDVSYNIYIYDMLSELYPNYSHSYINFWTDYGIGFGFILPFISGGLAITGAYVIRYSSRRDYKRLNETTDMYKKPVEMHKSPADMYIPPIPAKKDIMNKSTVDMEPETNFCPECGTRILKEGKFCPLCGIKFLKN